LSVREKTCEVDRRRRGLEVTPLARRHAVDPLRGECVNGITDEIRTKANRTRGDSLSSLVRRPFVQAVLALTLVGQVTTVLAKSDQPPEDGAISEARRVALATVELEPVAAAPDSALQKAWMEKAILREAERLGMEYRGKGYSVTPQLAMQIGAAAAEFEIDPDVAFGLVRAESSFRNTATSSVGAVGLTQLMPRTASWMEPGITRSQLRDPETNLRVGFKYLRYLLDKYEGDERLALVAYNRGPGTVDNALKRGRNPDNGYADFVHGEKNHGHKLFSR
jgi:soluble lytic murein transglycosylase-like protein